MSSNECKIRSVRASTTSYFPSPSISAMMILFTLTGTLTVCLGAICCITISSSSSSSLPSWIFARPVLNPLCALAIAFRKLCNVAVSEPRRLCCKYSSMDRTLVATTDDDLLILSCILTLSRSKICACPSALIHTMEFWS